MSRSSLQQLLIVTFGALAVSFLPSASAQQDQNAREIVTRDLPEAGGPAQWHQRHDRYQFSNEQR